MSTDTVTSASSAKQFLPDAQRRGTALCMSGGGFRAALFHLGACRRLNELGLLANVDTISSVSGGSVFAAHLAKAFIDNRDALGDYEGTIAQPFRAFVKNNIRSGPALERLYPWQWANSGAGAEALVEQYERHLLGGRGLTIGDLPDRPHFVFCATDVAFGVNWVFSKSRVGDFQVGYVSQAAGNATSVANAVAASSCFPPVFRPLPLKLAPGDLTGGDVPLGDERDHCLEALSLSDGGVYDNMGLEPVWKSHQTVIVCDGGKPFSFAKEVDLGHELLRIQDVIANQAEALRKRWLISSFVRGEYRGMYLGIRNAVSDFPVADAVGYSKELALRVISKIRTDLDRFSDDEIGVLENHGYTLTDAAYKAHLAKDDEVVGTIVPLSNHWWPEPASQLAWIEAQIANALSDSSTVHLLGH